MIKLFKKALKVLRTRPLQFMSNIRSVLLFRLTKLLQPLFFTESHGIFLANNVRIQRLRTLSAERPSSSISIGQDSIIYENAKIEAYSSGRISIGEKCIIGDARIYSRSKISIGNRVVTSWNVFIQDFDPHPIQPELRSHQMELMCENFVPSYKKNVQIPNLDWQFPLGEIHIGDDVWIGANTTILKDVKIGNGSIVATGAVVTAGNYPARSILGGVPAKVLNTIK